MGNQFNATFDLINLSFFGELAFKVRFLFSGQLLSDTIKPFIDGCVIGI